MVGIELWMEEEATRDRFGEAGVYRIHLNGAESHYVTSTHPPIDPGEPGLRFSFCMSRQLFCFNCLLRTQRRRVVLKVMTSDHKGNIYKEFWDIKSTEDVFEALTTKVYPRRYFTDAQGRYAYEDLRDGSVEVVVEDPDDAAWVVVPGYDDARRD